MVMLGMPPAVNASGGSWAVFSLQNGYAPSRVRGFARPALPVPRRGLFPAPWAVSSLQNGYGGKTGLNVREGAPILVNYRKVVVKCARGAPILVNFLWAVLMFLYFVDFVFFFPAISLLICFCYSLFLNNPQ